MNNITGTTSSDMIASIVDGATAEEAPEKKAGGKNVDRAKLLAQLYSGSISNNTKEVPRYKTTARSQHKTSHIHQHDDAFDSSIAKPDAVTMVLEGRKNRPPTASDKTTSLGDTKVSTRHNHKAQKEQVPDKTERTLDPPNQHISIRQAIDNDFDIICQAMENGIDPHDYTQSSGAGDDVEFDRSGQTLEETSGASERCHGGTSIYSMGHEVNEEKPPCAPPLPRTEPSLPGDYLPVASPVETPAERLERRRRLQEERNRNIPHATPQDPEEERKRRHRGRLCLASAVLLSVLGLVGIILGVTLRPSSSPVPSEEPTPAPTSPEVAELERLIKSVSFDGGASLNVTDSPQSKALTWLGGNANLEDYPDRKRIQRYILAVFYYSTNGDKWRRNTGWLSDEDECSWLTHETNAETRPVCDENGEYNHLRLEKNNLAGMLPLELALLSDSLSYLYLRLNHLNGTIPTELGLLTNIGYFDAEDSRLTGTIPTELALFGGVNAGIGISVRGNSLTGTIPTEILGTPGLGALVLSENLLTGSIPTYVGLASSNLVGLELNNNELTGSLPTELGRLSLLKEVYVHQNWLKGTIPSEIGLLTNLYYLAAGNMQISGSLPTELGSLSNLADLRLENNTIKGPIPSEIGDMSNVVDLYLRENSLSGSIPTELGRMTALDSLWLNKNSLTGTIPTELGLCHQLEVLALPDNALSGTFPIELTKLSSLLALFLSGNDITGLLPTEIGLLTNLVNTQMMVNWSGTIPSEIGGLTGLHGLFLSGPRMNGTIPSEMGNLAELELLQLWEVSVRGNFPSELGRLTNLALLLVSGTNVTGTIPAGLMHLTKLQLLGLEASRLTGTIPDSIRNLNMLEWLSLENNTLTGTIPSQIALMTTLETLELNGNNFTGPFTCPDFIDECAVSCENRNATECRVLQ